MSDRAGRLALVPPRFGPEIVGGAELVLRELAQGLAARGWSVEVLTTCARDHFTWANEYEPGVEDLDGVTVRRFPAAPPAGPAERAGLEAAILAGARLSLGEQERWMNAGVRAPGLYHHLLERAGDYRAIVCSPYLSWTTFACAQIAPERTILRPCLHDEPYASLELFQPVFSGVAGMWLQTDPEHELAHRLFSLPRRHRVVGEGVPVAETYDPSGFRRRYGIEGDFVLYAGRREGAKGWEQLLEGYARAVRRRRLPLSLVTVGVGEVRPPADIADRVIDLGLVPDRDRDGALAAAAAYVQPSRYESFSRTVMEAWLAGTPVIANGESAVVSWHCERSDAGLLYTDPYELEQCLAFVAEAPEDAAKLAAPGRQYVLEHYTWPAVMDRMEQTIGEWTCAS
ncbi:MAG: glycosyltransferase family 4 protein [Acidimicrobiales bacterium]